MLIGMVQGDKLPRMSSRSQLPFLVGESAMARLMRQHDWSHSPVGPPEQWPPELRSVVSLMLGSAFPMFLAWGPAQTMFYNDGYCDILGAKHPAALGEPFYEVWHEIRGDLKPLVQRAMRGEPFFMENLPLRLHRRGYDEDCWFTFSYSPVLNDGGASVGLYCVCIETTKVVLADRAHKAEHQRLQTLFHQAPGFVAVLRGPLHVFEFANHAYMQLTGFRDIIGKPLAEAVPEAVEQGFGALLDKVLATGETFVGRAMRIMINREPDKPPIEVHIDFVFQPEINALGQVETIFVQGHEVSEQHRAQQALLAFSNSVPAIAWQATPEGAVERFNFQWFAYTGLSDESALGSGWKAALHPDDLSVQRLAWQVARAGKMPWQSEYRLLRHDGVYRWFLARAVPQLDVEGRVLRWFGTTTDIDDVKKATQKLYEADRQKDEFLATLAHELRNPLAPILSAVQLLTQPSSTEAARWRASNVIGRQVAHMARLLDDLMDIARIARGRLVLQKVPTAVEAVVEMALEIARPLADAKQQTLTVSVSAKGLWLVADPLRLAQILSNLLNNASKYTDPDGRIALAVQVEGPWLTFTVTDSGIGMDEAAIGSVFTMFAQEQSALKRSHGGLGIGLALVKALVELHGGSVVAHSEGAERGSRFVVKLPFQADLSVSAASSAHAASAGPSARARTVLVADDNRDSANMLAELLRMDGHTVHTAYDGVQAVELAIQLQPDVLVLDIGMPGLNGYEVARRVRAQAWGQGPLLIAATGWGQEGDRQEALAAGFDLHLTKPFDPLALAALIADA